MSGYWRMLMGWFLLQFGACINERSCKLVLAQIHEVGVLGGAFGKIISCLQKKGVGASY